MTKTTTAKRRRRMAREPKPAAAEGQKKNSTEGSADEKTTVAAAPKEPSKNQKVIDLLVRMEGATLDELVTATGWLPHTTRAALTGLRKKGHTIERTSVEGVSRYSIAGTTST